MVENLWMLKVRESDTHSKCYYLDSEPDDKSVLIRHLVGFDAKKRSTPIVKASIVYSGWSPQTKIAKRFRPVLLRESTRTDWEKFVIGLAEAIRADPEQDEPKIDPVLQVALLRSVLEQAAAGNQPLEEELKAARGLWSKPALTSTSFGWTRTTRTPGKCARKRILRSSPCRRFPPFSHVSWPVVVSSSGRSVNFLVR